MIPTIMGKIFNNEKLSEASPLLGRGLGRGGDFVSSKQSISPSLEFVSSHSCLGFAPRSQSSAFGTSCLSAPSVRYPDSLRFVRPQIRFTNKFFSLPWRDRRHYSYNNLTNPSTSFTGTTDKIAKGIGKILDTSFVKKITEKFHNTNFEMHIMALTDALATGTFITQTAKSKKIEQDRKKALMYNAGISTGLCIAGGYAIDKLTKKPTDKFIKKFREANKNSPKLEKYIEGIKIVKPALILGSLYYIAIPLISTFLAERFDNKKDGQ